jgi:hypothetical protein
MALFIKVLTMRMVRKKVRIIKSKFGVFPPSPARRPWDVAGSNPD